VIEGGGDAGDKRLGQIFMSWNRPHQMLANFDLRFDDEAPELFRWFKHSGLNVVVQGRSGRPYTPAAVIDGVVTQIAESNSKNAPVQLTTDLKLNHYFRMFGRRVDIGLQGTNVFNNYLISRIDPVTGKGRIWGVGSYSPDAIGNITPDALEYLKVSQIQDPSNYGPGAAWRLSLDYDF
jgi:hypothetical protein